MQEVRLSLPAQPEMLSTARLVVASLAGQFGFSYDEVEDLRLAIEELCLVLMGPEPAGVIQLRFLFEAGVLEAEGTIEGSAGAAAANALSEQILEALVDELDIDAGGARRRIWLRRRATDLVS